MVREYLTLISMSFILTMQCVEVRLFEVIICILFLFLLRIDKRNLVYCRDEKKPSVCRDGTCIFISVCILHPHFI